MSHSQPTVDPQLERHGRRMLRPALRFLAIAIVLLVPGIVLVVVGSGGLLALGAVLIFLSLLPGTVAVALLLSSSVARWAARHKLFA
jgi:hypothetical protein